MSETTGRRGAPREHDGDAATDEPVIEVLDAYWQTAPEPDVEMLWSRIAPGLGPQPPPGRPWYRRGLPFAFAFTAATHRTVAIGATAVVVAAALVLGASALRPQQDASAAVIEAVQDLSAATDDALNDNALTSDETAHLRERAAALLQRIGGDDDALARLSSDELLDVITRLESVLARIASYRDAGDDGDAQLEEAEQSVRQVATAFDGERDRRGGSNDDEDRGGSSGSGDDGDRSGSSVSGGGGVEDDEVERPSPTASPTAVGAATTPAATPVTSASPTPEREEDHSGDAGDEHEDATATPVAPSASPVASTSPSATETGGLQPNTTEQLPAVAGEFTYAVGQAGTVRFSFDGGEDLEVLAATPNAGWTVRIDERDGSELRVEFHRDGVRGLFEAEREESQLQISIRWER